MSGLAARVQAHCQLLSSNIHDYRPDQIRNRLAYIVANAEALAKQREENP